MTEGKPIPKIFKPKKVNKKKRLSIKITSLKNTI